MTVLMSLSGFDEFSWLLVFLPNLSTVVVAARSILKQTWAGLSGIQYDWPSKARRPFFAATNYAAINLTGVSWLHWSQRRDSGFQLVWDVKGGGGDECLWASAWWIGQEVDEESGMVRLCARRHRGSRCRRGWKEDSSQLKAGKRGIKERGEGEMESKKKEIEQVHQSGRKFKGITEVLLLTLLTACLLHTKLQSLLMVIKC